MCRLRNIAMRDYQESVTTGQTDARQSDRYVPLCFAGNTKMAQCSMQHYKKALNQLNYTPITRYIPQLKSKFSELRGETWEVFVLRQVRLNLLLPPVVLPDGALFFLPGYCVLSSTQTARHSRVLIPLLSLYSSCWHTYLTCICKEQLTCIYSL